MIYQITNGIRCNVCDINASVSDMEAIAAVLEGKCELYKLEGDAFGSEVKGIELNPIGFSVSKKAITGSYKSTAVTLQHIKPTKTFSDIQTAVKGVWDADFTSGIKCDKVNGFRATSKGGIK